MSQKWMWILAIPVVGAALYLVSRALAAKQYALIVTHSGPGTLDITDGTHSYPSPTQVVVNATPETGYQANWNLNGVDVEQGVNQYSLYINGVNSLIVSFVAIGGPPSQPTGIRPVGTIAAQQNFRFWYGNPFAAVDIAECDENWNDGACKAARMTFKVYDAAGRGVPNIDVQVYPDINPDATAYKAYLLFGRIGEPFPWKAYSPTDPLILTTDADGLVTFDVLNTYGADNINVDGGGIELSRGTGLYANWESPIGSGRVFPVYHGVGAGLASWWSSNGGGGTISYNKIVRADIIGTDKSAIQSITVNFGVKWKA